MKKDNKIYLSLVIIVLIIIAGIYYFKGNNETPEEKIAECIGKNSLLYVQLGCSHCKTQEEMFGENIKYLNKIDCHFEPQKCIDAGITGTPAWAIKGEKYPGVKSIEKLKQLTGC